MSQKLQKIHPHLQLIPLGPDVSLKFRSYCEHTLYMYISFDKVFHPHQAFSIIALKRQPIVYFARYFETRTLNSVPMVISRQLSHLTR